MILKFYTDYIIYIKISYISSVDLSSTLYVNSDTCGSIKLHVGSLSGSETLFPLDYQILENGYHEIDILNAFNYFGQTNTTNTQSGILVQIKTDSGTTSNIKFTIKNYSL